VDRLVQVNSVFTSEDFVLVGHVCRKVAGKEN
jgi:hypothetical protein